MKHIVLGILLVFGSTVGPAFADVKSQGGIRPKARAIVVAQLVAPVVSQIVVTSAIAPETARDPAEVVVPVIATPSIPLFKTDLRPPARKAHIPRTRWQHMKGHEIWTRAALAALKDHGKPLVDLVPRDIASWCPGYPTASDAQRRAFWVGFMSALAKHESTYKPWAVGGGGQWYGLLQILPQTARWRKCNVGTGEALKSGAANLSCAVRIMAITVPRDGVIHGYKGKRGQGVTADWGPMHKASKRSDMARWTRRQNYCKPLDATRPKSRP